MPIARRLRPFALLIGLSVFLGLPAGGCDDGGGTKQVKVAPEVEKEQTNYAESIQKKMQLQHPPGRGGPQTKKPG
jgi:hypothetical protein